MAIILSDNINYNAPKHGDARYGPWSSVANANLNVLALQRVVGLTVGIQSGNTLDEYWYYTGVTDSDLVLKLAGGGSDPDQFAKLYEDNTFIGNQDIIGYIYVSGQTQDGYTYISRTGVIVSGSTLGDGTTIGAGNIQLEGSDGTTTFLSLSGDSSYFVVGLDGQLNNINPHDGPTISQLDNSGYTQSIIGFQPSTGWTDGRVTFYTLIQGMSGATFNGDVDITGVYKINGQVFSGGTLNHAELNNLDWANSNHTGTANTLAGFDASGNTVNYPLSSGSTIYTEPNKGIEILSGSTVNTIFNSGLGSTISSPDDVGGIPAGTTVADLTGKTMVDLFNDLLFPTVLPTYTIPTITLTGTPDSTKEVGSLYTPSINLYGDKNDAGAFNRLRILRDSSLIFSDTSLTPSSITAIPAQFGYADPNNPNYRYTISPTPYSESYTIPLGATTYQGDARYVGGVAKQDNKGVFDTRTSAIRDTDAPQSGDTNFGSTIYTVTGIYPYFYGDSATLPTLASISTAIQTGSATKILLPASGTLAIPYNVTGRYIWVAYMNSYTTKTKWFRTILDSGTIDNSFITTATTNLVTSPEGYWSGITFKMHWSVYSTTQTVFEYRNT